VFWFLKINLIYWYLDACIPQSLTCAIPEYLRDESLIIQLCAVLCVHFVFDLLASVSTSSSSRSPVVNEEKTEAMSLLSISAFSRMAEMAFSPVPLWFLSTTGRGEGLEWEMVDPCSLKKKTAVKWKLL